MKIVDIQVSEDIQQGRLIKLHLGAGAVHREGFYSVDLLEMPGVAVVADLNLPLTLLPDNCVAEIYSRHTLEHISNFEGLMSEICRICIPDARITIIVPHFSNPYFYSDPTHVRAFGLYTMDYCSSNGGQHRRKVPNYYFKFRFSVLLINIKFYRTSIIDRVFVPLLRALVNSGFAAQEIYERRWVWLWPASEIEYTLKPDK